MIKKIFRDKSQVYHFLLLATLASLPFPSYAFVSKMMILWAFYGLFIYKPFAYHKNLLRRRRFAFWVASLPFWMSVAGLLISNDPAAGVQVLVLKLPLLIVPLIVFSNPVPANIFRQAWGVFAWAVLAAGISAWTEAMAVKFFSGSDFIYYHEFGIFTQKHTTYFALFVTISALYFLYAFFLTGSFRKKIVYSLALGFQMYMLFILSNRTAFLALLTGTVIMLLVLKKWKIFLAGLLIIGTGIFLSQSFLEKHSRPDYRMLNDKIQYDAQKRMQIWKAVIDDWKQHNRWLGTGTGSRRDGLYRNYKEAGLTDAYLDKYNAHNQFLETLYNYGLTGLLLLVFQILVLMYLLWKHKFYEGYITYSVFLIFMLTESILVRQSGIMLYAFWVSLLWAVILTKEEKNSVIPKESGK